MPMKFNEAAIFTVFIPKIYCIQMGGEMGASAAYPGGLPVC